MLCGTLLCAVLRCSALLCADLHCNQKTNYAYNVQQASKTKTNKHAEAIFVGMILVERLGVRAGGRYIYIYIYVYTYIHIHIYMHIYIYI